MSNIPEARKRLEHLRDKFEFGGQYVDANNIDEILALLKRKPAARKARRRPIVINMRVRKRIHELAKDPNMTQQMIATATGVRSSARVSEVLNGLR